MEEKFKLLKKTLGEDRVKLNEPLRYHLDSKPEKEADCFYIATNLKELEQALSLATELKIPFTIFGSGTKAIISEEKIKGLVIKNRSSAVKISGVKGKVSPKGIGVDEAMIEIDSGVTLEKVNEFLSEQGLKELPFPFIKNSTLGGSLYITQPLQELTQKVKVFSDGHVFDIDILELKRGDYVLSAIIKVKSALDL